MAAKVTFIPSTKTIKAKAGVTNLDWKVDIYSDGKEDWLTDASLTKFRFPITTEGGRVVTGGKVIDPTFFLRDGWQIEPDDADHELTIVGNAYHDDGIDIVKVQGGYTISVNQNTTLSPDTGDTAVSGLSLGEYLALQ